MIRRGNRIPSDRTLDDLARKLVVKLRDGGECQRCGLSLESGPVDWAHVLNRTHKSIQWAAWNALGLCGPRINETSCHYWFDNNKLASMAWWREKFPDRALMLDAWRHTPERLRPKVDRVLIRLSLLDQIERMESGAAPA